MIPALVSETSETQGWAGLLKDAATRHAARTAVVLDGERHSYGSLWNAAVERARQLQTLGLQRGDRVALLLPNSMAFIEFFAGATLAGIVAVPVNIRFRSHELRHILKDSSVAAVITTGALDEHVNFKGLLAATLPGLAGCADPENLRLQGFPNLRRIVHIGPDTPAWMIPGDDLAARPGVFDIDSPLPGSEDLQLILYTSGTTAAPKGCLMPNRCLVSTGATTAELFDITPRDVWWCPLPMFHVGALLFMSVCFSAGASFVGMSRFDVEEALAQFRREKPSVLYPLFPTIVLPILDAPGFVDVDFSHVRYVFNVGPETVQRRIQDAFPRALLLSAYGMSETTGIVTFNVPEDPLEARLTTVGHFIPGWTARILDPDTGADLPAGTVGEIAAKGPALFAGYLNQHDLTRGSFTAEGYFRTGDLGSLSGDGLLRFHGRLKDQMKVGGENVSALEVESFLLGMDGIRLAQVVALPDAKYGEVPAAFVEPAPGVHLSEAEVLAYCHGRIASFKVPRHVRFVSEWPMSATKVAKFRLRQQLMDELGLA